MINDQTQEARVELPDPGELERKEQEQSALERLTALYGDDAVSDEAKPEAQPKPPQAKPEPPPRDIDPDDQADAERFHALQVQALAQQYATAEAGARQALALIAAAEQRAAAEPDKAKRAALMSDIAAARRELQAMAKQAYDELTAAEQQLIGRKQTRHQRRLAAERAKLPPDFDAAANRAYLERKGFTPEQIAAVNTAELALMVDRARRMEEQERGRSDAGKGKVVRIIPAHARKPRSAKRDTIRSPQFGVIPRDSRLGQLEEKLKVLYGDD